MAMMVSVYFLIFFSLVMGTVFALVFVWAVKTDQFKDIEAPKYEMFLDEEPLPGEVER
jgi:cbb3-type cytochrome oxidase maturation protein